MGEKDIFISYSWNCRKEFVDKLYNFLTEKGLRVWKDDQGGMKGNMFEDMRDGIDSSKLMIVCASEPYLDSKNCQLELEYGFKKNLPMIPIKLDHASKLDDHIVLSSLIYLHSDDDTDLCEQVATRIRNTSDLLKGEKSGSSVSTQAPKEKSKPQVFPLPPQVQTLFGSGKTLIVGVNCEGALFFRNEFTTFKPLYGRGKFMSIGPNGLFGCGMGDEVYFFQGTDWQKLYGSARTIASGKNSVMVTNGAFTTSKMIKIEKPIGTHLKHDWAGSDGHLWMVASSPDHDSIWGVSPAGECFFKPTVDASFQHVPGLKMKMIATGLLGAFGVTPEGFLFYRSGTNGKTSMGTGWQPVEGVGNVKWLTVSKRSILGTNTTDDIYRLDDIKFDGGNFTCRPSKQEGKMSQISVFDL